MKSNQRITGFLTLSSVTILINTTLNSVSADAQSRSPGVAGVRISRYFGSFTANRSTCSICGG
jgi:hypothetical protein